MFVYFLQCSDYSTYIGATVNLDRRLRQHNNIIKGGAKITTSKAKTGNTWRLVLYVSNFPDWRAALQFEWRWKQISRRMGKCETPLDRRLIALSELLALDRSTSNAVRYDEWDKIPQITVENNIETCCIYLSDESNNYKLA